MDGRLALYSGIAFAGVLAAGAFVFRPGFNDGGNATNAEAAGSSTINSNAAGSSAPADSGQRGDSRSFASRLTSIFTGHDEHDEHEHEEHEHEYEDDD